MDPLAQNNYERLKKLLDGDADAILYNETGQLNRDSATESFTISIVRKRRKVVEEWALTLSVIQEGPNKGRMLVDRKKVRTQKRDTHRNDRKQKGPDVRGPEGGIRVADDPVP